MSSLHSGDFDGNGITDLFIAASGLWRVSYNSNSSWTTINTSGTLPHQLALGWFNGNNRSDVFMADGAAFITSYEGISSWTTLASSTALTTALRIADFNGDNISDVIHSTTRNVSLSGNTSWQFCKTGVFPINTFSYGDF